ncbi:OapC/ArvC family zinc-ribbon domain-containing protein [Natronomonas sp.]|uniref:OapC/ArvC family zinc-ribbon domain-containing protein n=1 Tax=Natronomonas sp. TaxID=2184060 RepID=UPI0026187C61|nr:Zn-ribbon containing protein [Natronomonas sp.]
MPHQCTGCGRTFSDGSKEMLSGCPDCGGNTFQFRPADPSSGGPGDAESAAQTDATQTETGDPPGGSPSRPETDTSSVAETVGRATTKVRDLVSSDPTGTEPDADTEWPDDWGSQPTSSNPSVSSGKRDAERNAADRDGIIDADARRETPEDSEPKESAAQASARTDVVSPDELRSDPDTPDTPDPDTPDTPDTPDPDTPDTSTPDTSEFDSLDPVPEEAERPDGETETKGERPETETEAERPETSAQNARDAPAPASGEIVSEPTDEDPDLAELREQLNDQFESIKIIEPGQYELNLMELYDREEYIIALQENGRYVIQVPEQWIGDDPEGR